MRWLGLINDPVAGGSTLEDLETDEIPAPDLFIPVTSGQVDPGLQQLERTDEVRGRRANTAPISFASAPVLTLEARAYPKLLRPIIRAGLGGAVNSVGTPPAAVDSTVGTIQDGNLPAFIGWLLREGQLDRVTGAVVSEFELNFPADEEGTISVTMPALYHDVDDSANANDPNGDPAQALPSASYTGYVDTFMLRDAKAYRGASVVEIENLAGFGVTYNNSLIDEFRSRFQPGHNIETVVYDGETHKIWYPKRHKLGPQQVTGRVDLSDVDPDAEMRRVISHAEKLVFEVSAGPAGTTPPADEMMRIVLYKQSSTGGGAEPLRREGDQFASYEFSAYLDESVNKDVEVTFTGAAALT